MDFRPAQPPAWQRWFPSTVIVPVAPFWWGWSWGWGYYPIYPAPTDVPPGPSQQQPPPDPDRVATTLLATAAGEEHGGVAGLALAIDGHSAGFQATIDGISVDPSQGKDPSARALAVGWGTMHVTWSLVSERNIRVRLELGGSMLSMAESGPASAEPYAGSVAFGPSFGLSGNLGLVGPFGIEGHARMTPRPVPVTDSRIALALRAGPLALSLGYRTLDVHGDGTDAPEIHFGGPELGLAFRF